MYASAFVYTVRLLMSKHVYLHIMDMNRNRGPSEDQTLNFQPLGQKATRRTQYPLTKEHTLNYGGLTIMMIEGYVPQIKGYGDLWATA